MASMREIAGIEHELFTRVVASLAHKQVSPVSIVRMTVSIIKKSLEKSPVPLEKFPAYIANINNQLDEVVTNIRGIRLWDSRSRDVAFPNVVIKQVADLMSMRLSVKHIRLENSDIEFEDKHEVNHAHLRYMLLAILSYFEDAIETPSILNIFRSEQKTIQVIVKSAAQADNAVKAATDKKTEHKVDYKIDQAALILLANAYLFELDFSGQQIRLSWA